MAHISLEIQKIKKIEKLYLPREDSILFQKLQRNELNDRPQNGSLENYCKASLPSAAVQVLKSLPNVKIKEGLLAFLNIEGHQ